MKEESKMLHWHSVYKLSAVTSPTEEVSIEFSNDETKAPSMTGKRLSLLCSNMQAEEETMLRSFLTSKLNKNEELDFESSILSIEPNYFVQDVPTQIYYKVITTTSNLLDGNSDENKFLICFVAATISGLELYQKDLDVYSDGLLPYLEKYNESVDISEYLQLLDSWYETNIGFVARCLQYFGESLAVLITAGYCCIPINFDENVKKDVQNDIQRLMRCCSLSQFFTDNDSQESINTISTFQGLALLNNQEHITVTLDGDGRYMLDKQNTSTFCVECVNSMFKLKSPDSIKMRQLLENYKLKIIQDMNTFKRYLKQAETDYYVLYRTYIFLITSGNGLVLLKNTKLQNSIETSTNTTKIVDTLENFIQQNGGFTILDTNDKKQELLSKLTW